MVLLFYFTYRMFYSAANFRTYVNQSEGTSGDVVVLFEPERVFTTKFFQIGLKPIGVITYDKDGKEELTTHNGILTMFKGHQPIVTVHPAFADIFRNQKLQGFVLKDSKISSSGYSYAPLEFYKGITADIFIKVLNGKILIS